MGPPNQPKGHSLALGLAIVILGAFSISAHNVLVPVVYEAGTNAPTLLVIRNLGFVLVCGLWMLSRSQALALPARDLQHCIGAGLAYAITSGALIAFFGEIPISLAILVFYLFPLLTRLGESCLDRRAPSFFELLCFLAALLGLGLILGHGWDQVNALGLIYAFIAALGLSTSYLWTGRKLKHLSSTVITFHMAWSGLLAALIFAGLTNTWLFPKLCLGTGVCSRSPPCSS